MHKIPVWILCLFLSGCITVTSEPELSSEQWTNSSRALTNIRQVQLGMTYGEAAGIMGDAINVGYQKSDDLEGAYETIPVKVPYREEILEGTHKTYRVVYYFTHIRKSDGIISDDELTPLIFENDQLIGKGRNSLFMLKDRLK